MKLLVFFIVAFLLYETIGVIAFELPSLHALFGK